MRYINIYLLLLFIILSVEQKTIAGNVNLASNRDYNHGAIIRIYMG